MGRDVEVHSVSLYPFHSEWVKENISDEEFNFSEWVREKIEEEAEDAPAFMDV